MTIAERLTNLKTQREQAIANVNALHGAIAILEEMLAEEQVKLSVVPPTKPAE